MQFTRGNPEKTTQTLERQSMDFAPRQHISTYGFNYSTIAKHNTVVMLQTPYSPDMTPCDFFLFSKLKGH